MKYKAKFYEPKGMKTKDHCFVGIVWPIVGSKGNTYEVELHHKGFSCSCPGFSFRGQCKHTVAVAERFLVDSVPEYCI
jgi:hypothetical protein